MLKLSSDIQIGQYRFRGVHEVEVDSSWDNLTDTCTLVFPRKVSWQGKPLATGDDPILKRQMPVTVRLGYDGAMTEVFRGFIRDVSGEIPVKVTCEDAMYLLKQGEFTRSYRDTSTTALMADLIGATVPYKMSADTQLGQFRISKATPAKVLEYLREHYFVRSWFREGTLHVGLAYDAALQRERKIRFDRNVIEHDLEYRQKDDVRLKLKAVILKPDNKKEEIEIGDPEGEQRTFHYYNLTATEAKTNLEREAERLRYTGYRGSFTTFGKPDIRHGDVVLLSDPIYPEREGRYLVKRVKIKFGMNGYRQEVELETKT